jgi:group I intron endonuclease
MIGRNNSLTTKKCGIIRVLRTVNRLATKSRCSMAVLSKRANQNSGILCLGSDMKYGGVYEITNNVNGKRYVGSSVNIKKRWSQHKCMLRRGNHRNPYLQNAYNKYGADAFRYSILVYTEPMDGVRLENILLKTGAYEYNIGADATKPWLGKKRSDKTNRKISEALRGPKSPMYGKQFSEITRNKISAARMGIRFSEEHKSKLSTARSKRTGEKSSFYGGRHTEETKMKISGSRRIKFSETKLKRMLELRERGYSYSKIAEMVDSNFGTVRRRIISIQNKSTYLADL